MYKKYKFIIKVYKVSWLGRCTTNQVVMLASCWAFWRATSAYSDASAASSSSCPSCSRRLSRSWFVSSAIEVAAAQVNKADDGCVRLTSGCCSEVPSPVFGCFATIFSLIGELSFVCSTAGTWTTKVSQVAVFTNEKSWCGRGIRNGR